MPKLILLRHIKSQWNEENRFTGWVDVPLNENETYKAKELAEKIFQLPERGEAERRVEMKANSERGKLHRLQIDKIYTSPLFRNMDTVARLFEGGNKKYPVFIHLDGGKTQKWGHFTDISESNFPVFVSEKLNERYYGRLQGENKETAMQKYGKEQVHLWRRGYALAPPGGESLKDVIKRTIPFYKKYIEKDLKNGKNVLIVASHNSLRAIVKYVEKISDKDIINLEIPYGGLIEYELNGSLKLKNKKIL